MSVVFYEKRIWHAFLLHNFSTCITLSLKENVKYIGYYVLLGFKINDIIFGK